MKKIVMAIPLVVVFTLTIFTSIYILSERNPEKPPSTLLNKKMPTFTTKSIYNYEKIITNADLNNKHVLINFFSSWCAPCKTEHPLIFKIKKEFPNLFILGINYKDKTADAKNYLASEGDPYSFIGIDNDGVIGLDFGVFGLPETFLINKKGEIVFKHIGPLTKKIIYEKIKPYL